MSYSDIARESLDDQAYDSRPDVSREYFEDQIDDVLARIDQNIEEFGDSFPSSASEDLQYQHVDGMTGWTPSFWTGMLWLAYEVTGDDVYRQTAERHLDTFERRLEEGGTETHDLGFLYTLGAVAAYNATGNERARDVALSAADRLTDRYLPDAGILQAWGPMDESHEHSGRMIVDTMMNLPLLYWASEQTGDDSYRRIAEEHADTTVESLVRPDASTFHTYRFDVETGDPIAGETHQGYSDESTWTRGQAWAMYGFALTDSYLATGEFTDLSAKASNYFLNRLPDDHVPRWDFDAPADDTDRDSSAAAIAVCALDELTSVLPIADEDHHRYPNAALAMLQSLSENYLTDPDTSNGVLDHGVYGKPGGDGVDECCIWGDYFYLEGLVRVTSNWDRYW